MNPTVIQDTKVGNQYYGTLCILILLFSNGLSNGWNSPSFPVLLSESESPLPSGPLTVDEVSWIVSSVSIGCLFGGLLIGWLMEALGRKVAGCIISFIQILSWLLVIFAQNPYWLLVSKFLVGLGGGGAFILVPIYVTEISETKIRGFLGSTVMLSWNIGLLVAFIVGDYIYCMLTPFLYVAFNVLFYVMFVRLPDSPVYLAKKGRILEAERSLRFFRGLGIHEVSDTYRDDMEMMVKISKTNEAEQSGLKSRVEFKDFITQASKRALMIGTVVCALNQFSGMFALANYTATVFEEAGSSLSPNTSSIIVGVTQLVGSYISTVLVERAGRKFLLILSSIGTGLGLAVIAIYAQVSLNNDLEMLKWIPLVGFSFAIFAANIGIVNLTFLVIAEVMPIKIKTIGTSFCLVVFNVTAFLVLKFFPITMDSYGIQAPVTFFSVSCLMGALFLFIYLPETKGRTLEEIQIMLSK